jgi:hypothetical protein
MVTLTRSPSNTRTFIGIRRTLPQFAHRDDRRTLGVLNFAIMSRLVAGCFVGMGVSSRFRRVDCDAPLIGEREPLLVVRRNRIGGAGRVLRRAHLTLVTGNVGHEAQQKGSRPTDRERRRQSNEGEAFAENGENRRRPLEP